MKHFIIRHLVSSVAGKIDGTSLSSLVADGECEATGAKFEDAAWICGRTNLQQHLMQLDTPTVPWLQMSEKITSQ